MAAAGGNRRGSISLNNPDKTRQAKIDAAKAKRQRAMEYGNSALKATTREGQLKDLKKQASRALTIFLFFFCDGQRITPSFTILIAAGIICQA